MRYQEVTQSVSEPALPHNRWRQTYPKDRMKWGLCEIAPVADCGDGNCQGGAPCSEAGSCGSEQREVWTVAVE